MLSKLRFRHVAAMALVLATGSRAWADDGVWSVSKSSGEVWVTTTGAEQVSLQKEAALKPGDTIRTGGNGRVLLVRGEETILISPNSVIGVPTENKDGMSTTILQQAGSILLEVEKRNVKHFEVETPYLAAVVKGTQFGVTIDGARTRVDVRRGQVEVSDFKSGQIALVMPGQAATSLERGKLGLSLSGSGQFNPIEQGKPRPSSIDRIPVPKGGLPAPRNAGDGKVIHALARTGASVANLPATSGQSPARDAGPAKRNGIRIANALGEVRLNVHKATNGLAHGVTTANGVRGASRNLAVEDNTVWGSDAKSTAVATSAAASPAVGNGSSNGGTSAASGGVSASATSGSSGAAATYAGIIGFIRTEVALVEKAVAKAKGAGKPVGAGNGNGPANGNGPGSGNGPGNGNGQGNGNGNGGVGNFKGNGNMKH